MTMIWRRYNGSRLSRLHLFDHGRSLCRMVAESAASELPGKTVARPCPLCSAKARAAGVVIPGPIRARAMAAWSRELLEAMAPEDAGSA